MKIPNQSSTQNPNKRAGISKKIFCFRCRYSTSPVKTRSDQTSKNTKTELVDDERS